MSEKPTDDFFLDLSILVGRLHVSFKKDDIPGSERAIKDIEDRLHAVKKVIVDRKRMLKGE